MITLLSLQQKAQNRVKIASKSSTFLEDFRPFLTKSSTFLEGFSAETRVVIEFFFLPLKREEIYLETKWFIEGVKWMGNWRKSCGSGRRTYPSHFL